MKRKIGWILIPLALVGCASSVTYQYQAPKVQSGGETFIRDLRGENEKKAEVMSVNKNSCWFGIYRLGDNQIEPTKLELLSSFLKQDISEAKIDTLQVSRFEMFNNIQRGMRSGISKLSFGLTSLVPSEGQVRSGGCVDAFDLTNNPENKESIVVLYDVGVNGKRFIGKKIQVEPEIRGGGESVRSPTTKARIVKAISEVAKEIAIQSGFSNSNPDSVKK